MAMIPFDDRDGVLWMDSRMVPWRDAKVHVLTHGLHYASAVFEGERVYGGNIFESEAHSRRLHRSAEILGFRVPFAVAEIEAAKTVRLNELNVQNQQRIVWPAKLIVAMAYLDQLERSQALPAGQITVIRNAIRIAENSRLTKGLGKLREHAQTLKATAATATNPLDARRMEALAEVLQKPVR